jgi:hypothetical protein
MRRLLSIFVLFLLLAGCGQATPEIKDTGQPGSIQALVFLDANQNGAYDSGDEGLQAQVWVSQQLSCPPTDMNKITKQPTGPDGLAVFKDLKPGSYCAGIFGNYGMTTRQNIQVYLSSNQEAKIVFGLTEKP